MKPPASIPTVTVVTVTYGKRWHLLRQALRSAFEAGVDRAIVVSNGADEDTAQLARAEFGSYADVVVLERNTGSAGGFRSGLERARKTGAERILLLDDDNRLQSDAMVRLAAAYDRHVHEVAPDRLAMLAYRQVRQRDLAERVPSVASDSANPSAFFGFHVLDVPMKIFRRTAAGRNWLANRKVHDEVVVSVGPYSGLYFHRSVLETVGMPDERFLLYADDTDFSFRLTRAGGRIVLVSGARLLDLEPSWNIDAGFSNTLDGLLAGQGDFRVFYSTRNNAYFERWRRGGGGVLWHLNRGVYLMALRLRAAMMGRRQRFELLLRAVRDGEAQRLGENRDFPL